MNRGGRLSSARKSGDGKESPFSPRGVEQSIPILIYEKNGGNNFFMYKEKVSAYFEEHYLEAGLFIKTGKEKPMR